MISETLIVGGVLLFMALTDDDYKMAAKELGCEVAALRAVAEVESPKGAFLDDGRPSLLFEAHIFHRYTRGRFDKTHPHISSPRWNKKLYRRGAGEWDRLVEAVELDRKAALMSASYGRFQICGFNFASCRFTEIESFVAAMKESEEAQLEAFIEFIKTKELADELQRHDWAGFARIYNGAEFRANHYDTRMASAYEKFSTKEVSHDS